jgi:NAD(P)-dependent dehydrogenase (short-subunit alcohol dehydrogenase family)
MTKNTRRISALVTGASRGIGRAIAIVLALRGVRVAVHYQANQIAARETLGKLAGRGHALFSADLADAAATATLWREVSEEFGRIDLLVNNAGIYREHPPLAVGVEEWQEAWRATLATNLLGPANLSLRAAQAMSELPERRARSWGRGRIVNISSRGAFRGEPDAPAYGASKAGLNSLSQSLAKALAPRGVYVYCLAPGWVETEMAAAYIAGAAGAELLAQHPLGRIAGSEEIAQAAAFCALDAPAAMTGSIIDLNGASYLRT